MRLHAHTHKHARMHTQTHVHALEEIPSDKWAEDNLEGKNLLAPPPFSTPI